MGKPGGLATYFGVAQGDNLAAFRIGFLDATNTVPCSVGVMYQFIAHATSSFRIKPTASVSLARVFSCASDKDPRQGSPDTNGAMTGGAGVRIAMLRGRHIAASFDLMGYVERRTSASPKADPLSKGVMVGIAIHGARR